MSLSIGDKAPDFQLFNQEGKSIRLSDFRGKNVILYFYPKAMTPGCTVQACGMRDVVDDLQQLNYVTIGVSPDPVKRLKTFAEKHNLSFGLLSDEDFSLAKAYGAWGLKKFMGREYFGVIRKTFLIDEDGKLKFIVSKVTTKSHHSDVLNIIK